MNGQGIQPLRLTRLSVEALLPGMAVISERGRVCYLRGKREPVEGSDREWWAYTWYDQAGRARFGTDAFPAGSLVPVLLPASGGELS